MKKLTFLIATLLATSQLFAQDMTFDDWDTDDDGLIERFEFTQKFVDNYFKMWDPSETEGILEEDFFKSSYAGLDTDGDQMLSDEEWLIGYNYFYEDYITTAEVNFVDVNNDGRITYEEYHDVLYDLDYFTDVDVDEDNYISEYELADYVFDNWDFNDNGTIGVYEYSRFDWYYLDV
ncbi:EF-hand domain-containing protein [Fulvivirga lutea]|uniref:EF-hand domain-containing protein n=1 Tax=Fulvivirga lutea TaxID=2810512 RepID=A0A974WFF0_9BACT|nr:hypothetical protein [Fulvivirga lutea]QSE97468.1 hypothetical protein JR347_18110 [Fulvivirga lutea]